MAVKANNIINQNIQTTYHIDQQIEKKEENERKETKEDEHSNFCEDYSDYLDSIYNDEKEIINDNDPILNNFDDKILNEMTLKYKTYTRKIKIFGDKFVNNNKNNCYILIDGQRKLLCEYFELSLKKLQLNLPLEFKLIENESIIYELYVI